MVATPLYPLHLKIAGRLCIVVGGGGVAVRKVRSLLRCRAKVRVISGTVQHELQQLAREDQLEWFGRDYAEGDLRGAFLVFAATNDRTIQEKIAAEAEQMGVLLNSADDPHASHFHVPAHFRRGRMLVSISTGGASPALAKKIRRELEGIVPEQYGAVVELMALIREEVVGSNEDTAAHTAFFRRLLEHGFIDIVLRGDWFQLQMLLLRELPAGIDGVEIMKRFVATQENGPR